jgi:Protein of unknown function (DUF2793)
LSRCEGCPDVSSVLTFKLSKIDTREGNTSLFIIMATPRLGLNELFSGQFNKEVAVNENSRILESFAGALAPSNVFLNTPPVSPGNGSIYLIGTSPTGIWTTKANNLAIYTLNGYLYVNPVTNVVVRDTSGAHYIWNGTAWVSYSVGSVYSASSVGTGAEVYKQTVVNTFEFRSLVASGSNVTVTENANDIEIAVAPTVPFAQFQAVSSGFTLSNSSHSLIYTATGTFTITLPDSGTITNNIQVQVRNRGTGTITFTPSGSATREPATGDLTTQHADVWLGFDTASNRWYIAGL